MSLGSSHMKMPISSSLEWNRNAVITEALSWKNNALSK